MKALFISLVLCLFFFNVYSWKYFHNGRVVGGNLGAPCKHGLTEEKNNFTRWFTQSQDHFDVGNLDTWQQRYFVNDEYLDEDRRNVAFLMIGGEGTASDIWMTSGSWIDYGKQHNAILFQLEHRFYGKSHPTKDMSLENLKYLTSEQALADVAFFVEAMNSEYNLSSEVRWIAFGGSYAGSLAAWARLKYPHLIHGAVSTSGPLRALPDFQDYIQIVGNDLRTISEECYVAVESGTAQIDTYLQHKEGQRTITKLFQLCDSLEESMENDNDLSTLYETLAGNFAGIAQYNNNNRMSTMGTLTGRINLDTVCEIMTDESAGSEITRLANFNTLMLNATNQKCLDFKYSNMIESMKHVSWDSVTAVGRRPWTYQTCNEFGFYQTSSKKPQIFGDKFPLVYYINQCEDIFGPGFNSSYLDIVTDRTNIIYGALDIEVTNVVFVHGSVDPWHALGIIKTQSLNAPAIFINGTAHCANMYSEAETDLPQLKAARLEIGHHIQTWLSS